MVTTLRVEIDDTPTGPSIGRGYGRLLDILELLAVRRESITISELARELDIPKATTSLVVQHLLARDYVSVSPDRGLTIGPRYLRLGFMVADRFTGGAYSHSVVQDIARKTGLDAYLGIINGDEVVYVDKSNGRQSVRVDVELGLPRPLHCTAIGKAALAFGPSTLWTALDQGPSKLHRYTSKTLVTRKALLEDIEKARELGYVIVDGELYEGHMSIAVPVHDRGGISRILIALGHSQVVRDRVPEIVSVLQSGAEALGTQEGDRE